MKNEKPSLLFLDSLRGLAALYVVIGHARWLLWEGGDNFYKNIKSYSWLKCAETIGMSFFKYGHEMVLFFFVLSGFVIHLSNSSKLNSEKKFAFSYPIFLSKRVRRIFPPFMFALLLTYLCDSFISLNDFSIYNDSLPNEQLNSNIDFDHSLTTLFGNVLFLQTIYVPVYGSNGPLWSLAYEWWFYMIYPILLFMSKKNKMATTIAIAAISLLLSFGLRTSFEWFDKIFGYLFSWWLGVVAADIYTKRIQLSSAIYKPLMIIIPLIPYFAQSNITDLLKANIVALGFFGLILFLLHNRNNIAVKTLEKVNFLGKFSYSLYVTHFPLLVLMNGVLLSLTNNKFPSHYGFVWAGVIIVVVFAYFIHFVIEIPFITIKKKIKLPEGVLHSQEQ